MDIDIFLKAQIDRLCPICFGNDLELVSSSMQFNLNLNTVICKKCSFVFTNPIPREEIYNRFYVEAYSHFYGKISPKPLRSNSHIVSKKVVWWADQIDKYKKLKNASLLEVGPGNGMFSYWASKKEAKVTCIEPSNEFNAYLKELGLNVYNGTLEENGLKEEKFDIIALFHVLEHVYDLNKSICALKNFLKDDGILVIEVPNILKPFRNLDHYFLRYVHLSNFSPETIKLLLAKHQLEILFIDVGGDEWKMPQSIFIIAKRNNNIAQQNLEDLPNYKNVVKKVGEYRLLWNNELEAKWKNLLFKRKAQKYINLFKRPLVRIKKIITNLV